MIPYRPGHWGLRFSLSIKGSVLPKAAAFALPAAILSVILHEVWVVHPEWKDAMGAADSGVDVVAGINFVLGFLIVFRAQQAYSRWWEGATLLQQVRGEWFNVFSSVLAFCNADPEKQEEVTRFRHVLVRLLSMLYGGSLSDLVESNDTFQYIDFSDFDAASLEFLQSAHNSSEVLLQWIQRLIYEASEGGVVKVAPPLLSRVYNNLANGMTFLSNAQKLNELAIPFPIAQLILLMMCLHWCLVVIVCATSMSSSVWVFLISFSVIMCYWSVHYIGQELEMPYGEDPNDLPVREMQIDFNLSLVDLMRERAQSPPAFKFQLSKHKDLKVENLSFRSYLTHVHEARQASHECLDVLGGEDAAGFSAAAKRASRQMAAACSMDAKPTGFGKPGDESEQHLRPREGAVSQASKKVPSQRGGDEEAPPTQHHHLGGPWPSSSGLSSDTLAVPAESTEAGGSIQQVRKAADPPRAVMSGQPVVETRQM